MALTRVLYHLGGGGVLGLDPGFGLLCLTSDSELIPELASNMQVGAETCTSLSLFGEHVDACTPSI